MKTKQGTRRTTARRGIAFALLGVLIAVTVGVPVVGDDRDLFRSQSVTPYVMMLLDVSDSMTWESDDSMALASGDDPGSKLYQAKSALYTVIGGLRNRTGIGFAHFRQSSHQFNQKRWLYKRATGVVDPPWFSDARAFPWPRAGEPIAFGDELRPSTASTFDGTSDDDSAAASAGDGLINSSYEFVFPLRSSSTSISTTRLEACKAPDNPNNVPETDVPIDDLEPWVVSNGKHEGDNISVDEYKLARLSVYPKLGHGSTETWMYTVRGGVKYEVRIFPLQNGQEPHFPAPGNPPYIDLRITVRRVTCSSSGPIQYPFATDSSTPTTIRMVPFYQQDYESTPHTFTGVTDYISRHATSRAGQANNVHQEHNYFLGDERDYTVSHTCTEGSVGGAWNGEDAYWEPNNNPSSDGPADYTTFPDPYNRSCPGGCLSRGDVVPWDWKPPLPGTHGYEHDAATEIAWRMAPNLSVGETSPDFRIARYFEDHKSGGVLPLKPEFKPGSSTQPQKYPPLAANSYTPLGGMLDNFRDWYEDWVTVAAHPTNGDPQFECKERYAILLTDGAETCDTDGPDAAGDLRSKGIRTFVIAFGAGVTADDVDDIANAGGTGKTDTDGDGLPDCLQFDTCTGNPQSLPNGAGVIIASNRDELVEALEGVFEVLELEPTTFATGAVPAAQTESEDTVTLTSFQPLEASAVWPGTINQFIRPLPLLEDAEGNLKPDLNADCGPTTSVSCLAWNAAEQILEQAPNATEVLTDLKIGPDDAQRRVSYTTGASSASTPVPLKAFKHPVTADEHDLWNGLGIAFVAGNSTSEAAARSQATTIVRETLREKVIADPRVPDGSLLITYVLGDSFHSDPRFLGGPADFFKLASDLEGNGADCADTMTPNPGYRCFFEKHRYRRQVLMLGSNDGQIHAFDAGTFSYDVVDHRIEGDFDAGTGNELFSHVPRRMLSHVAALATDSNNHGWGVDGSIMFDDVFVDPIHSGTPTPSQREWRTLAIGGYREGGIGYYALDLTQPDPLDTETVRNVAGVDEEVFVPVSSTSYVPRCNTNYSESTCGPLPYPSVRWEFADACDGTTACAEGRKDEDANGAPDLGFSWSKVNTGRVQVKAGENTEIRYVAVFGGGLDRARLDTVGNFIYMVDIETGKVLYKRALVGAAPSEPAAVDTDQNGLLDSIYIGTVRGHLYKIDISAPGQLDLQGRVSSSSQWVPLRIFDTEGRPIFLPPTVTFINQTGYYALAFGTGDRENLWSNDIEDQGRFYMVVDTGFNASNLSQPLLESDFEIIEKDDLPSSGNFLVHPLTDTRAGWVLTLDPLERVTSEAAAISGLLVFNSYTPTSDPDAQVTDACVNQGFASIYALLASNANALGLGARARTTPGFASSPYISPSSASGNEPGTSSTEDPFVTDEIQAIHDNLKSLFPPRCKFGAFGLRLAANISNTAHFAIAEVPICIVLKNWKEF